MSNYKGYFHIKGSRIRTILNDTLTDNSDNSFIQIIFVIYF